MKVSDLAGLGKMRQLGHRFEQNFFISLALTGPAKGTAHGVIHKHGARRWNLGHDIEDGADDQGGNFLALDHVSDETDGLVAKGSVGNQECQLCACLF